jgi:hypothetical protein
VCVYVEIACKTEENEDIKSYIVFTRDIILNDFVAAIMFDLRRRGNLIFVARRGDDNLTSERNIKNVLIKSFTQ